MIKLIKMFLKNTFKRAVLEWNYYTRRPWSLEEVGKFWDTVKDYDEINDKLYTYTKRFSVSKNEFDKNIKDFIPNKILDIQTRSGNGTIFWNSFFPNAEYTCVDFSCGLIAKAKKKIKLVKKKKFLIINDISLKYFNNEKFNLILTYETLEHVYEYKKYINMLSNLLDDGGYIILTTPNVPWEIVHWLTAIVGYNHSEGPHRFISKKNIDVAIKQANLKIISYTPSIFFPFNNKFSIFLDNLISRILPKTIKQFIFLRHIYILKKN